MTDKKVNVYILGAGASAEDGAPLMSEWTNKAFPHFGGKKKGSAIHLFGDIKDEGELERYRSVFELADYFYSTNLVSQMEEYIETSILPSCIDSIDIEDFFTRIDNMAKGKKSYGLEWSEEKISKTKKDAGFFFYHTLCIETGKAFKRVHPLKHYLKFVENALIQGTKHCIITFNYDMLLEGAMFYPPRYCDGEYSNPIFNRGYFDTNRFPWTYGIPFSSILNCPRYKIEDEKLAEIYYLKLHGSLNWGMCPITKEICMHYPSQDDKIYSKFYKGDYKCSDGQHVSEPVLIPPTRMKDLEILGLKEIWKKAKNFLEQTNELYIIGYSLPKADDGAKELIEDSLKHPLSRLVLANINPSHSKKFKQLLKPYISEDKISEYGSFKSYLVGEYHINNLS